MTEVFLYRVKCRAGHQGFMKRYFDLLESLKGQLGLFSRNTRVSLRGARMDEQQLQRTSCVYKEASLPALYTS